MKSNELKLLFELAKNKGCKFTTLTYRSSESGELARHTLLFGVDYTAAIKRDIKFLTKLVKTIGDRKFTFDGANEYAAAEELLASMQKSLVKHENEPSKKDKDDEVYETIYPGVKQHKDTGVYYLWGLSLKKKVLQPSTKASKPVKSQPLTIAKDKIRDRLRTNRYRQFKLNNIDTAAVNGNTLSLN